MRPLTLSHKNHRHIDDKSRPDILACDAAIRDAVADNDTQALQTQLEALLNLRFFQAREWEAENLVPLDKLNNVCESLDKCKLDAGKDDISRYANAFAEEFIRLEMQVVPNADTPKHTDDTATEAHVDDAATKAHKAEIANMARDYLNTNRSDKADFQTSLVRSFRIDGILTQRCSAQKMALETFIEAFPVLRSRQEKLQEGSALPLLRKLIEVLPHLEHHPIVERNAQRRGVRVLEKALEHLTPDEAAEILADTMASISKLSKQLSMRKVKAAIPEKVRESDWTYAPVFAAGTISATFDGVAIMTATGSASGAAFTAAAASAVTGYAAIPFVVMAGAHAYAKYLGIEKQAQGTALYMLGHQLTKLRRNWDQVNPANRDKLIGSFDRMRNDILNSAGVKNSTLKRFFNDSFIDPSTFNPDSNAFVEGCKRMNHGLSAALFSRLDSIPNNIRGYETGTAEERRLCDSLLEYYSEAHQNGVCDQPFPLDVLENLRMHIPEKEYQKAVSALSQSFAGIRRSGVLRQPLIAYADRRTKGETLGKIVTIANELATGNQQDIQKLVDAALKGVKNRRYTPNDGMFILEVEILERVNIGGYEVGSKGEKRLCESLLDYYREARRIGATKERLPENFLINLRAQLPKDNYETAVNVLADCFGRVRGGRGLGRGPMADYTNPLSKGKILRKIVEMTTLLANGEQEFVNAFVDAAKLADKNCHNNARQIFQALWHAVLVDKVKSGQVQLNTDEGVSDIEIDEALVRVGVAFFREQELFQATFDVLGKDINVEVGLAVIIALGKRLGLLDPVQGMGYNHVAYNVTREKLAEIEEKFFDKINKQDSILDYLKTWSPLTDWLKAQSKSAEEEFEKVQDTYFGILPEERTREQDNAFVAAADKYQNTIRATLETSIPALLKRYPAALTTDGVADLVFVPGTANAQTSSPVGVDGPRWQTFVAGMENVTREEEVGGSAASAEEPDFSHQYVHPDITVTNTPTNLRDLPLGVAPNAGGGDCLFYALGVPQEQVPTIREELAAEIRRGEDDDHARNRNAHYVVAALTQTPAVAARARELTDGRHAVPNSVYAQLVAVPGIYAGPEELSVWTTLPANQHTSVLVVSSQGPLYRIRNGRQEPIDYTVDNKARILRNAIEHAGIALYQTDNHWQLIRKPAATLDRRRMDDTDPMQASGSNVSPKKPAGWRRFAPTLRSKRSAPQVVPGPKGKAPLQSASATQSQRIPQQGLPPAGPSTRTNPSPSASMPVIIRERIAQVDQTLAQAETMLQQGFLEAWIANLRHDTANLRAEREILLAVPDNQPAGALEELDNNAKRACDDVEADLKNLRMYQRWDFK
jgi:hypothetical protein